RLGDDAATANGGFYSGDASVGVQNRRFFAFVALCRASVQRLGDDAALGNDGFFKDATLSCDFSSFGDGSVGVSPADAAPPSGVFPDGVGLLGVFSDVNLLDVLFSGDGLPGVSADGAKSAKGASGGSLTILRKPRVFPDTRLGADGENEGFGQTPSLNAISKRFQRPIFFGDDIFLRFSLSSGLSSLVPPRRRGKVRRA
ncbi:MAG: hypothetical protein IJX36_02200, partial [Thermoguttaceae bacterium]|nr:hypothetical protein [Thermoguttaceae bacterium]